METEDAIIFLQHAASHLFASRILGGRSESLTGTSPEWQAITILQTRRNHLQRELRSRQLDVSSPNGILVPGFEAAR